jgi:hypothetical protein
MVLSLPVPLPSTELLLTAPVVQSINDEIIIGLLKKKKSFKTNAIRTCD